MTVMDFPGDGDGAIEMIDRLWVITSFPVDQADVADGLAFFESVPQFLFYFQGTTEKVERASSVAQVLVTVADEPKGDRFAMSVLEFLISREGLFVFRKRSRRPSRRVDAFSVCKEFVGRCTVLRQCWDNDSQYEQCRMCKCGPHVKLRIVYPPTNPTAADCSVLPFTSQARTQMKYFDPARNICLGGFTEFSWTRPRQTRSPSAVTMRTSYAATFGTGSQRMLKSEP